MPRLLEHTINFSFLLQKMFQSFPKLKVRILIQDLIRQNNLFTISTEKTVELRIKSYSRGKWNKKYEKLTRNHWMLLSTIEHVCILLHPISLWIFGFPFTFHELFFALTFFFFANLHLEHVAMFHSRNFISSTEENRKIDNNISLA